MIFVTVGTHEQPFDRLIIAIDELKKCGIITEEVIVQVGYSNYKPQYCEWHKMIPYDDMNKYISEARIVITHGGPASFIAALQVGKIPIVVPRKFEFDEHINNHQVEFVNQVAERNKNIIPVYDIEDLGKCIVDYPNTVKTLKQSLSNNNILFNSQLNDIVLELLGS